MSEKLIKRPRLVEASNSNAPPGYHYEGERASMYQGKVTQRLRQNILPQIAREVMYADLYCSVITHRTDTDKKNKDLVNYHCCIQDTCAVVQIFVKTSGLIIFQNFFNHLTLLLHANDHLTYRETF
jgi:hypothetical protein